MIDPLIQPLVAAQASVTALVGGRIYPQVVTQNSAMPAITYDLLGLRGNPTFQTGGPRKYRVQFECWGKRYADASAVRAALLSSLDGFSGPIAGAVIQSVNVCGAHGEFDHELEQSSLCIEFYIVFNS